MTDSKELRINEFRIDNITRRVKFIETQIVKDGIDADIYVFINDNSKDLAIVRVKRGNKTPLQKVISGTTTIEGFVSGEGVLEIISDGGSKNVYKFGSDLENNIVSVKVGQTMQWHANGSKDLCFYELCEPPYAEGRFINLSS